MLPQHMDGGARRLVMDVTGASDDVDIAYAFARREYAFEKISFFFFWTSDKHYVATDKSSST